MRLGELRRTGGQLAVAVAHGVADEGLGARRRAGRDTGPHRAPQEVRERDHGARVDDLVRLRQHLLGREAVALSM